MAHLLLQFSQPHVIASLAVNQFADAGDACLWTTPQQTLSMRDSRRGSVLPGILDVLTRNTCQKAAVRRFELPEVATHYDIQSTEGAIDATPADLGSADLADDFA